MLTAHERRAAAANAVDIEALEEAMRRLYPQAQGFLQLNVYQQHHVWDMTIAIQVMGRDSLAGAR